MNEKQALDIFRKAGALLEGHFLLTSGLHSEFYWEKFHVLKYPEYTSKLCGMFAGHFKEEKIQVVAGPTTGGIILAFETAKQMGVRGIFAEKDGAGRSFKRMFTIEPGERVLIVDDILTTGGSVVEVIEAVKNLKGDIRGIGLLVDRSSPKVDLGYPTFSCIRSATQAYKPEECPLCAKGLPLVRLGG